MKGSVVSFLAAVAGVAEASVQGFDISGYQGTVNFAGAYSSGARFVIIKVSQVKMGGLQAGQIDGVESSKLQGT